MTAPTPRFRKIPCKLWIDSEFLSMSNTGKLVYFYLLTNPCTNSVPGLYRLSEYQAADELGMDLKGFREGFAEPFRKGFVKASWKDKVVWVNSAVEYNFPENPNVVKGWVKCMDEIPDCELKLEAIQTLEVVLKGLGEGFAEPFRKGLANSIERVCQIKNRNKSKSSEQEQEQEPEQEQEKSFIDSDESKPAKRKPSENKSSIEVNRYYRAAYEFKCGHEPKMGVIANRCIERFTLKVGKEDACRIIDFYFIHPDPYFKKNGYSPAILERQADKLWYELSNPVNAVDNLASNSRNISIEANNAMVANEMIQRKKLESKNEQL